MAESFLEFCGKLKAAPLFPRLEITQSSDVEGPLSNKELDIGAGLGIKGAVCEVIGYTKKTGKDGKAIASIMAHDIHTGNMYEDLAPTKRYAVVQKSQDETKMDAVGEEKQERLRTAMGAMEPQELDVFLDQGGVSDEVKDHMRQLHLKRELGGRGR